MSSQGSHHGHSFQRGLLEGIQRTTEFGRFGRLFPKLKPFVADSDALKALADAMRDDSSTSALTSDNQNIPAGYTYLGQFIDHDITLDVTPLGAIPGGQYRLNIENDGKIPGKRTKWV